MTPTLAGRIQTRLLLVVVVGGAWTLLVGPLLGRIASAGIGTVYSTAALALAVIVIAGVGWDCGYQVLQAYRWEKDWPALFGLVTGCNEFAGLVVVFSVLDRPVDAAVAVHFWTTWLLVWFVGNGPLRVVLLRWRFRGGRVVGRRRDRGTVGAAMTTTDASDR